MVIPKESNTKTSLEERKNEPLIRRRAQRPWFYMSENRHASGHREMPRRIAIHPALVAAAELRFGGHGMLPDRLLTDQRCRETNNNLNFSFCEG